MGIERHHDMVLELGTIGVGQIIDPITLPMDSDAPFICRAISGYFYSDPGTADQLLTPLPEFLLARFADADSNWLQTARTPGIVTTGSVANYLPLRKHVIYPAKSVAQWQFQNLAGFEMQGVKIIMRGVKLFPGDRYTAPCYAPTYPDCYTQGNFQYFADFTLNGGVERLNQPLYINDDADFAWRSTLLSSNPRFETSQIGALELRIRDPLGKSYASVGNGGAVWLNAQALFGFCPNPHRWFPELYMGKGQALYYDIRNTNPTLPSVGQFSLEGAKVFKKSMLGGR